MLHPAVQAGWGIFHFFTFLFLQAGGRAARPGTNGGKRMKIIYKDGTVAECPKEEELHVIRHTAAHVMAQAIKRLYPQADFAFRPRDRERLLL